MGRYYPLDKSGKETLYESNKPSEGGGSQYHEDTPTFESLQNNAGQGIRGVPGYSKGQEEYALRNKRGRDAGELGKKYADHFKK